MRIALSAYAAALAFLALHAAPSPASAEDRLVLAPAGDWQFSEYDDRCRVAREFGAGEDRTTLWIEQGGIEPNYNVTLIGRPLRHPYGGGVHVRFGDEPEFIRSYVSAKSSRGRPVLMMYGLRINRERPERGQVRKGNEMEFDIGRAADVTSLNLRTSIVQPLSLEMGPMVEPLGFLGLCGAKLSGILSEAGRALTGEAAPPEPIKPDRWLSRGDYPRYLARANMGGELVVRLTVNQQGRASSCFVTGSDAQQLFDDTVCLKLMQRATFRPARNATGKPVASYYFHEVEFETAG
jgi:TonB family protein